jgi:hypothetical protein
MNFDMDRQQKKQISPNIPLSADRYFFILAGTATLEVILSGKAALVYG